MNTIKQINMRKKLIKFKLKRLNIKENLSKEIKRTIDKFEDEDDISKI